MNQEEKKLIELLQSFGEMEKTRKVKGFKHLNQIVRTGQTVLAGSSLMEGFPINELMISMGLSGVVYNRGIGGITTDILLENIDSCILDLKPKKLFINIGTNDLAQPGFSIDQLERNYRKILTRVTDSLPDCKIHLLAYYPMNEVHKFPGIENNMMQTTRSNKLLNSCNQMIRAMADDLGLFFIDLNQPLLDDQGQLKVEYTVEGVHLYPNAYVEILKGLLPYLRE